MGSIGELPEDFFEKNTHTGDWYRDYTLDANSLAQRCPLDNHRVAKDGPNDLGDLEILSLELLHAILALVDVKTLTDFRRVNHQALGVVNSLPHYASVIKFAPDVIRGILSIETGRWITCQLLYDTLRSPNCESCGDFGGYIYLITCKRVCFLCFTNHQAYLPCGYGHAKRKFGLSFKKLNSLPHMMSRPRIYCQWRGKLRRRRYRLVDFRSARDCARESMDPESLDVTGGQRTALTEPTEHAPYTDEMEDCPFDRKGENAQRFMAIVRAPHLLHRNSPLEFGAYCELCEEADDCNWPVHWRRRFTKSSFAAHVLECHPLQALNGSQQS